MIAQQIGSGGKQVVGRLLPTETKMGARTFTRARAPSPLIYVFIFSLALPINFYLGPLRLTPYRLLLIAMFIPSLLTWLSGKPDRIRTPDMLILGTAMWASVANFIHQDATNAIQSSGIFVIETFGSYIFAKYLIRDKSSFYIMSKAIILLLFIILPFGIYETITGHDIFRIILRLPHYYIDTRAGFHRVFGPFEHPILFGVFSSGAFALSIYVFNYGKSLFRKLVCAALVGLSVLISLSSGPLTALLAQCGIILWDRITRRIPRRWTGMLILSIAAYIFIDVMSRTTPIRWLIWHMAFSPESAFGRLVIWDVGSATAMSHPLFGTGGAWDHPSWMSSSMDMFWLVNAVTYGIPAALMIAFATLSILIKLGRIKTTDARLLSYRTGLIVTIAGLSLAGWAVHFWNAVYVYFIFMLGSASCLYNDPNQQIESENSNIEYLIKGKQNSKFIKQDEQKLIQNDLLLTNKNSNTTLDGCKT